MAHLFYKVLDRSLLHFDMLYKIGYNEMKMRFNEEDPRSGLHYCLLNDLPYWLETADASSIVVKVTLFPDSKVVRGKCRFRTNKFHLSDPEPLPDFLNRYFNPYYLVICDGFNIRFVEKHRQNVVMALDAVSQSGYAVQYVDLDAQWVEVCMAAIENAPYSYRLLPLKPDVVTEVVLKKCGLILQYVPHWQITPERCEVAVRQNPFAIAFVPPKYLTNEICLAAVQQNAYAIKHIPLEFQTAAVAAVAWRQNNKIWGWLKKEHQEAILYKDRVRSSLLLERALMK